MRDAIPEPDQDTGHDELAGSAMERSRLYGLLAAVFGHEPSAEFLSQLKTPEMATALAGAGVEPGDELNADALGIEYTRLFLGPGGHISPHESVQLKRGSGILWGAETAAVLDAYRAGGFDLGQSETHIPDHLSVELDFMSLLARHESGAWTEQDLASAGEFLRLQHDFITRHLGKWVAGFCAKVTEIAEFAFYPAFAGLLLGYLSGEKAEIVSRLDLADAADNPRPGIAVIAALTPREPTSHRRSLPD